MVHMTAVREDLLSLGAGHGYAWLHGGRTESTMGEATVVGIIEYHLKTDGAWCAGTVRWDTQGKHHLVTLDPLTIEPSLLCTVCGSHGWVRDGAWVSA